MEIKEKILNKCCTTEGSRLEVIYMFKYFEEREKKFIDFLIHIDTLEGLLTRRGLNNLLKEAFKETYYEFIEHIKVKIYLDKNKDFIRRLGKK